MLDQRRRRWADVVQMLYKCFVFAGTGYLDQDLSEVLFWRQDVYSDFYVISMKIKYRIYRITMFSVEVGPIWIRCYVSFLCILPAEKPKSQIGLR